MGLWSLMKSIWPQRYKDFFCTDALIPTAAVTINKTFTDNNHRKKILLIFQLQIKNLSCSYYASFWGLAYQISDFVYLTDKGLKSEIHPSHF